MFDELRDLYDSVILERGRKPRNGTKLAVFDAEAKGDNPMCGDRVHVFVRHEAGRIAELGFAARGCAVSVAAADLMAEAVSGLSDSEALALGNSFEKMTKTGLGDEQSLATLRPMAGVAAYPSRIKCAMLPWVALAAALAGEGTASSE